MIIKFSKVINSATNSIIFHSACITLYLYLYMVSHEDAHVSVSNYLMMFIMIKEKKGYVCV